MENILSMTTNLLPKEQKRKIGAILKIFELFDEIVPEEKQEALFKAISEATPTYKIAKKIHFQGKIYPVALFIGDPESEAPQKKKDKKNGT